MAARHFAQSVPSFEEEDSEVEEASLDVLRTGRHAKRPVLEYVSAPVTSFAVEVPADADADTLARARIEEILLELEASLAQPEPVEEPEPEPVPDVEHEEPSGVNEVLALEALPELEPVEPELVDSPSADSESSQSLGFWSKTETSEVASDSVEATLVAHDVEKSAHESSSDDELESTAVLDHEAIRKAVQEQEDSEEEVVHVQRHERLEVGSGFYVPPNNSTSEIGTGLATRKPRLSFFARIGEFIARVLHMDD